MNQPVNTGRKSLTAHGPRSFVAGRGLAVVILAAAMAVGLAWAAGHGGAAEAGKAASAPSPASKRPATANSVIFLMGCMSAPRK